jgi:hypothetical protein
MSNYVGYGTLTTDIPTDSVNCRGWTTCTAALDAGTGVLTWEYKGPDGIWRGIVGDSNGFIEPAVFTSESHMFNVFFGGDVQVRATGSSAAGGLTWDWQIFGNVANRDS